MEVWFRGSTIVSHVQGPVSSPQEGNGKENMSGQGDKAQNILSTLGQLPGKWGVGLKASDNLNKWTSQKALDSDSVS